MAIYLYNLWNTLRASLWLFPFFMIILSIIFSYFTIQWDHALENQEISSYFIWKGEDASGAQRLLSAIASSVITLTGIVFSLTIITLSLASTHYGARILRNFMQDFFTQFVLGIFISTSVYCLLVLRTITHEPYEFVPNVSISISLILAILTWAMLIYFIHHVAVMVQFEKIVSRVGTDLIKTIEVTFPNQKEDSDKVRELPAISQYTHVLLIPSSQNGYLQAIDYKRLLKIAKHHDSIIEIPCRPGNFITQDSVLAKIYSSNPSLARLRSSIQKAFIIGWKRNPTQDVEYAADQLVGIALRSLTLNDTISANICVDYLGAALCVLCQKELHSSYYYDHHHQLRLIAKQVTFSGLANTAFNQIRQYGSKSAAVVIHLLEIFHSILSFAQTHEQAMAIKKHILMVKNVGENLPEENDRLDIQKRINAIFALKNYPKNHLKASASEF